MDQQPPSCQYDNIKINSYFLRTLAMSKIPTEDWKGFIPFEGKNWLTYTKEQLYSEARTYYNTNILPLLSTTTPESSQAQSTEHKALAINTHSTDQLRQSIQSNTNQSNNNDNRGHSRGRGRGGRGQYQGRGSGRGYYNSNNNNYNYNSNTSQRQEYPRDPNAWCNYHCKYGHSNEQCHSQQHAIAQLPQQHRPQSRTQSQIQNESSPQPQYQPQYQPYNPNNGPSTKTQLTKHMLKNQLPYRKTHGSTTPGVLTI